MAESSPVRSYRIDTANASRFPIPDRKLSLNGWPGIWRDVPFESEPLRRFSKMTTSPPESPVPYPSAKFPALYPAWRSYRRPRHSARRHDMARRGIPRDGHGHAEPGGKPLHHLGPGYGAKRSPSSLSGLVMPSLIQRLQESWTDGTPLARRARLRYAGAGAERANGPVIGRSGGKRGR